MTRIRHIAIATQQPEETATFYKDALGLREVGRIDNENTEGYYLTDGHVNVAILKFKSETVAGDKGTEYSGIHHIGFHVEDAEATDVMLRKAGSVPLEDINTRLNVDRGTVHGGRNVELKYAGPDGVMIDVSQGGWVGTDD